MRVAVASAQGPDGLHATEFPERRPVDCGSAVHARRFCAPRRRRQQGVHQDTDRLLDAHAPANQDVENLAGQGGLDHVRSGEIGAVPLVERVGE